MTEEESDNPAPLYARPPWEIYAVSATVISGLLASIVLSSTGFHSPASIARTCLSVLLSMALLAISWAAMRAPIYQLHRNTLRISSWWNPRDVRVLDTMQLKSVFLGIFPMLGLPVLDFGSWGVFGIPGSELVFSDGARCCIPRYYVGGPAMIRATFSRFGSAVAAGKKSMS